MIVALNYVDADVRAVVYLVMLAFAVIATLTFPRRAVERPWHLLGISVVGTLVVLSFDAISAAGW